MCVNLCERMLGILFFTIWDINNDFPLVSQYTAPVELRLNSLPSKFQSLFVNYHGKLVVQIAVIASAHNHVLIQNDNGNRYHLMSEYLSYQALWPENCCS